MDGRTPNLCCERCGERIGVYEAIWWHRPDGSIVDSSYLDVRDDPRAKDPDSKLYHRRCLGPIEPLAG